MGYEKVFSFGFQVGNNWFGLGTSSPFSGALEFVSNISALGLAMMAWPFCVACCTVQLRM